jgi:AcrR family transcriptional regulator
MARTIKKPEVRKAEIMDSAQHLFNTKGFDQTTIEKILQRINVAKGTFYYYFKSKNDILNAIIEREIEQRMRTLNSIVAETGINAVEKLKRIVAVTVQKNNEPSEVIDFLHKNENIVMHHKTIVQTVKKTAPLIAKVIEQGIKEKQFKTEFPKELSEILLLSMNFLFDPSVFSWNSEEYSSRLKAMEDVFEATLRVRKGTLHFLYSEFADLMKQHSRHGRKTYAR